MNIDWITIHSGINRNKLRIIEHRFNLKIYGANRYDQTFYSCIVMTNAHNKGGKQKRLLFRTDKSLTSTWWGFADVS